MANKVIKQLFELLQPDCKAIYLGGSSTQKYLKHPHDIDYICFVDTPYDAAKLKIQIAINQKRHPELFSKKDDFIQIRYTTKEEHTYGSYINRDMEYLCGEKVNLTFDPADKDRDEYISILKNKINSVRNPKRYYQFYRGYLIASKRSYDLTKEEIENLNILHDQEDKDREKINNLVYNLKINIEKLN